MTPIRKIKDHFYYKDLQRQHQSSPKQPNNPFDKTLFILPNEGSDKVKRFERFAKDWGENPVRPSFVIFDTEPNQFISDEYTVYLTKKDVDWKGIASKEKLSQILSQNFDLLINMDTTGHRSMEHLSTSAKAHFKIGLCETNLKIYDLLVETESGSEIMKNLNMIDDVLKSLRS